MDGPPYTIEQLRADASRLRAERDEARHVAAMLAHAYLHDSRPPTDWVDKASAWGRTSKLVSVLRAGVANADVKGHNYVMLSVPRLARDRHKPDPILRVAPGLQGRVVNEDERCGTSVIEISIAAARRFVEQMEAL